MLAKMTESLDFIDFSDPENRANKNSLSGGTMAALNVLVGYFCFY
jgi:hypothetical protein